MYSWLSLLTILIYSHVIVKAQTPVVLWHGMGDDCCNPDSMGRITDLIKQHVPGIFVHSVKIGDSENSDRNAGFFGVIDNQVDYACEQLATIPELANGFNAVGFSQGGLFMRAYVERCNQPQVRHLVTFGSPHGGVSDIPNCENIHDFKCTLMRTMVKRGVYTDYVQHHVIQAQYFKSPSDYEAYLEHNIFLPRLNNQIESKYQNTTYRDNLASLESFVMIKFADDTMIKPPESAWFWTLDQDNEIWPLKDQVIYQDDLLGLQLLDHDAKLKFMTCPGSHMQISDDYFVNQVIQPLLSSTGDQNKVNGPGIRFVNQQA